MNAVFDHSPDWRVLGLVVALHLAGFFALANLPAQVHVAEPQGSLMANVIAAPSLPPAPRPLDQRPMPPRPAVQPSPPPVLAVPVESAALLEEDIPPPPSEPSPVAIVPVENLPVAQQISADPAPESAPVTLPRFDADYLENPAPAYPALSRRLAEQGLVLLRVYVEPDGRAARVELRQSSGHHRLDNAARSAVSRWRFVPARKGAASVGAWVVVPVSFNLRS